MITYFDTSALVPLLIDESGTETCTRLWNESSRVTGSRLLYPEACAALSRATRMGRLTPAQRESTRSDLDDLIAQIDRIELDEHLANAAGRLAIEHGLRGYDAVHLAAAASIADDDLVMVTGDRGVAAASRACGLAVAITSN